MFYKKIGMRFVSTLIVVLFFAGCQAQQTPVQEQANGGTVIKLDKAAFAEKIAEENMQFVDVRTPGEFNAGHIKGAVNIDYTSPDFPDKIQQLDKDKPVAIYCQSGNRSGRASKVMLSLGFKEVYDLTGGYSHWK